MNNRRPGGWLRPIVMLGCLAFASPAPAQTAARIDRENLALGKTATASSTQDDSHWPGAAVDGEVGSRWCASDGSHPQWLVVDLGRPEALTGCRIAWEDSEAQYTYQVEGSPDRKSWSPLVLSGTPADSKRAGFHPFAATATRFVRLTVTGLSAGQWASIYEFEVFGTRAAPAVVRGEIKRPDPQAILREVKVPAGFEATVFAAPPDVRYPTCLASAPTGEVFVGIDENGSLDAKADRGRVVRCIDGDGDGRADRFNVFAAMDSPRGLVWDAGTLYVLHPPTLTAFRDVDGDGTADSSEVLVEGIGFDLKYRGADHTTNGIRLAIDGYLYVAVGDYGFVRAQGKDGGPLQLLGGGVVRVRTDGTGLEIVSRGQRNIYDVAISPTLDLFTRDNTNDGDGWDVRLSHVVPTGQYGYPSLFKRFGGEIIPPLADYGGGSPCGSIYLQEPGFPAGFGDTLYTCEWGRGAVYRHPLSPRGATFEAGQETFVTIPRPTDIDVDGSGRIMISSWHDGGFTYSKPNVGYVVRVVASGANHEPFPNLATATPAALVQHIGSGSSVLRLAAQREILRRGLDDATSVMLKSVLESKSAGLPGRIAAVFTLAQGLGSKADEGLIGLVRTNRELRAAAIKVLADRRDPVAADSPVAGAITAALADPDPRVRVAASVASGRLQVLAAVPGLLTATADTDPTVAHVAIQALAKLRAIDACLAALANPATGPGATRALQMIHEVAVVDGLALIVTGSQGVGARDAALRALCRLYFAEAPYVAGQWWGTRPDTTGPYYKAVTWAGSEAVGRTLRAALAGADPAAARRLLIEMVRNKVDFEESTALAAQLAEADPELRTAVVSLMVGRPTLSAAAVRFLGATATVPAVAPALRVVAIRGLLRHRNEEPARTAAVAALAAGGAADDPDGEFLGAWNEYARDGRQLRDLDAAVRLAEGADPARGTLGYAVLVAAATNDKAPEPTRAAANRALKRGWEDPDRTSRLLRAVGLAKAGKFGPQVLPLLTSASPAVRREADFAARRLNLALPADSAAAASKSIAATPYDAVLATTLADPGDAGLGAKLFERQGCVACHAVDKTGPIKGPYLGDVAARYNRAELVESILKPSARIAQGFETQKIALTNGQTIEGFVAREAGDEVELRNSTGAIVLIPKADIEERGKSELSVMPQGLLDPLTPHDLASLLAYLESIKGR